MSPLVSLTLTVSNENDNDNHSYDSNRNHKNNVSKRIKKNMTQQQRGQEPRRRKNADPIECSYKMLEDATRIGSNSIPRDSMQECATVQFWRLDRGEDLLRWCHRTRRLILLIQNWNITSARPTRISFQVKSKLLRGIVEGSLEQKDACGRKPDYRTLEIFQWALDALAYFMLDHTGQMRNHHKLQTTMACLIPVLGISCSQQLALDTRGPSERHSFGIKNRWRIQRM